MITENHETEQLENETKSLLLSTEHQITDFLKQLDQDTSFFEDDY